jgi:type IV pilus assembly protein PilM
MKEKFSVGLDIGTQAIKAVKLRFTKEAFELCGFYLEPIESDLGGALKRVKESYGIDAVNTSLSGPATVIRYVNFPMMNENEFRRSLKFEAQRYIPFSTAEINLDGYILKKEGVADDKMLVLIVSAKKEFVNQRIKLLEEAGLKVNIVDIDSLALVNAFNLNYSLHDNQGVRAIALLNIGSSLSNLNILEDGLPRLSRDIHIAGNNFTHKLIDTLGMDFRVAESLKINSSAVSFDKLVVSPEQSPGALRVNGEQSRAINPDKDRLSKVVAAAEAVLSILVAEIRTSFDFYESQSTFSVGKIFLSGGGSYFTGLKDMLANLLGIEVDYWNPLKCLTLSKKIDSEKVNSKSSQLAVAVGLALRNK